MKNQNLIAARKQSGKTQVQVAEEVGISEIGYRAHERGTRIPNVITANKIARLFGTTAEKLWGYGDTKVL